MKPFVVNVTVVNAAPHQNTRISRSAIAGLAGLVFFFFNVGLARAQSPPASQPVSAPASQPASAPTGGAVLTVEEALHLAFTQNRDLIAARLQVNAAEVERAAAGVYPNPVLNYSFGNFVIGAPNPQGGAVRRLATPFDQGQHTIGLSEVLDIWAKRNARISAAERGIDQARLLLDDVVREVSYAVRSSFAEVVREQAELDLAQQTRARYDETVTLSRRRFAAGDISETELKKIELEGLRYVNAQVDAETQLDVARLHLAAVLGFDSAARLPPALADAALDVRRPLALEALLARALGERPDLKALTAGRARADATLSAERREALPAPSLGVSYTHSDFGVSGDNPNAMGLTVSLPLPLFDRNQGGIGRAALDVERIDNDTKRLTLEVRRQVAEATRATERASALLDTFEKGGMIERADRALRVAEKSYKAGAISLLELLEAQRTYIETRGAYLRTLYEYRQALIDVAHAVGASDGRLF